MKYIIFYILTIYLALRTNLFPLGRLPCRDHLITSRSSWIELPLRFFFPMLFSSWDTVCLCAPRIPAEIMVGLFYKDSEIMKGKVKVAQSCPTLCDPLGYTVHGILQARILEWTAVPFSRRSSQPRNWTRVSCIAGGFFTSWATRGAQWKENLQFVRKTYSS